MARLIGQRAMNHAVSHLAEVKGAVSDEADKVGRHAKSNLARARSSTRWHKIHGPDHLTDVSVTHGDVDSFVNLDAPNPMAIEFGHSPSGVFGPGGSLGHLKTKSPEGLYILIRAAISGSPS